MPRRPLIIRCPPAVNGNLESTSARQKEKISSIAPAGGNSHLKSSPSFRRPPCTRMGAITTFPRNVVSACPFSKRPQRRTRNHGLRHGSESCLASSFSNCLSLHVPDMHRQSHLLLLAQHSRHSVLPAYSRTLLQLGLVFLGSRAALDGADLIFRRRVRSMKATQRLRTSLRRRHECVARSVECRSTCKQSHVVPKSQSPERKPRFLAGPCHAPDGKRSLVPSGSMTRSAKFSQGHVSTSRYILHGSARPQPDWTTDD